MMGLRTTTSDIQINPKVNLVEARWTTVEWIALAMFWCLLCGGFIYAASVQAKMLNLSAAAGGQMPYLEYAQHIAEDGFPAWYGDHNRMPLIPTVFASVYTNDWASFVVRSRWFSIGVSTCVLLSVSACSFYFLPLLSAAAFSTIIAFTVLLSRASFVQAELLYYSLSFFSWLLMCRLLQKPSIKLAMVAGVTLGLAYLTKASSWPMLLAFLCTVLITQLWSIVHKYPNEKAKADTIRSKKWLSSVMVVVTFFLIVSPYVWHNYQAFGKLFYNVNSTYFMWCDNWPEAKAFADAYDIGDSLPDADSSSIPSASQYFRTHTWSQMWARLSYGLSTLFLLSMQGTYAKYLIMSIGFSSFILWRHRDGFSAILKTYMPGLLFSIMCSVGYVLVYAWYVPVAYGDRFILSLYTPLLFCTFWIPQQLANNQSKIQRRLSTNTWRNWFSTIVLVVLILDYGISIRHTLYTPTKNFVRFYYNESKAILLAGNSKEAVLGFRGVATLDADYAQARLDLGILALTQGQPSEAITWLQEAVSIDANSADAWNSLGSAYNANGDFGQGIEAFRHAVELDPTFAMAWFNLGGTCNQVGLREEARLVYDKLKSLDLSLAGQLAQLLPEDASSTSAP